MTDQQRLRQLVDYNPDTGAFVWRSSRGSRKAGAACGKPRQDGYTRFGVDGENHYAHRLAWLYVYGKWPDGVIDHINGDRSDNRICNLREADLTLNAQNRTVANPRTKTGVLGVSVIKSGGPKIYRAQIVVNRKHKSIGLFETLEEAKNAYWAAKKELHKGCPAV